MKKILVSFIILCVAVNVYGQTKMQGTIKPGSNPGTIDIYVKPSATFSQKDEAMSFALAIPATVQPAPSIGTSGTTANGTGLVDGMTGLQPNFISNSLGSTLREVVTSVETINTVSYYVYTFIFAGTALSNHDWTTDAEQKLFTIAFNGCTTNCSVGSIKLVNLPNGGVTKNAYWYFQPNTVGDITNYPAPFYANPLSGIPNNGGSNNGSALSTLDLASAVILPLKLLSFNATVNNCSVSLSWQTARESNFAYYIVERSETSIGYREVGRITTTPGASQSYTYIDNSAPIGTVYYRIRFVDNDGSSTYSSVKEVGLNCTGKNNVLVYPNPTKGVINIILPVGFGNAKVRVLNAEGKEVASDNSSVLNRSVNIKGLPNGSYFIETIKDDKIYSSTKIILQH
jgi:hypothetical protein